MDQKLKALKVVDLKLILSNAHESAPAKATKPDLIARILASEQAIAAYAALHPDQTPSSLKTTPSSQPASAPAPAPASGPAPAPTPAPAPVSSQPPPDAAVSSAAAPAVDAPSTDAPPDASVAEDPDLEKRKQRAARFGIPIVQPKAPATKKLEKSSRNPPSKPTPVIDDPEKLKARAARFGIEKQTPAVQPSAGKKRPAPAEQIDPEELERRRKRAERFGTSVSASAAKA